MEDGDENDLMEAERRSGGCGRRDHGADHWDAHDGVRQSGYSHLLRPWLRMEMLQAPLHGDLRPYRYKKELSVEALGVNPDRCYLTGSVPSRPRLLRTGATQGSIAEPL